MSLARVLLLVSLLTLLLVPLVPVHEAHAQGFSSVYVDPLRTDSNTTFILNVRVNLTSAESVGGFDVRLNYTYSPSVVRVNETDPFSISFAGNIFQSAGIGTLLATECLNGIIISNTQCEPADLSLGVVHIAVTGLGKSVQGPITGGLLFSVRFNVLGRGTSPFLINRANIVNVGSGPYPVAHIVNLIIQDGVFANSGLVAFFNTRPFNPLTSTALLPGPPGVMFDAGGSFNADNASILIANYAWSFGDGVSVNTTSPVTVHSFNVPGRYIVGLTAVDAKGGTASTTRTVVVVPALGTISLTVNDLQGRPLRGNVQVQVYNSTTSTAYFDSRVTSNTGGVLFSNLSPGTYLLSFSGQGVESSSKMENVVGGITTSDTIYLKVVAPPTFLPPPYDIIFVGSLVGGVGAFTVGLILRRKRMGRGGGPERPVKKKRRRAG
jgi:hypothetical protein